MSRLSRLLLTVDPSPETNDHEVQIWIDGTNVLEPLSAMGLDPDDLFHGPNALRPDAYDTTVTIGRCNCGCLGCGDIDVRIELEGDHVLWARSGRTAWRFSRADYETEIRRAMSDTSWETPDRTAARLVREGIPSIAHHLDDLGLKFDWASGRIEVGCFDVSLSGNEGQVMVRIASDRDPPARLAARMLERLLEEQPPRRRRS